MRCDEGIADGDEGSMPAIIANYGEKVVLANVKNFLNKEILAQYGWQVMFSFCWASRKCSIVIAALWSNWRFSELAQFCNNWSSPNAWKVVILFGEPFTKITFHLV